MIEFDDLKGAWKEFSKAQEEQHRLNAEQIKQALENRTLNAIGKIKYALNLDMALLALVTVFMLGYALFFDQTVLPLLLLVFAIVWGFTLLLNIAVHLLLNRVVSAKADLKTSLTRLVQKFGSGIRSVYLLWLVAPVAGVFLGFLVHSSTGSLTIKMFFILLGIGLGIGILLFPLMYWYLNKMVGKHYQELKRCLAELNEEAPVDDSEE
ncbi:MAG TPA: hypothetical protein PK239_14290 [Chitinophagales bacterium]|nr:hypothetical protein [Chitinophagales bacterium]HRK28441.1 hypothetical protein [Chitinophagales bacterium]